ncbi:bifunctional adenosylcobinamide kinase/adenosylcobinamide-phosphate guanylyltransferase [Rhodococcus sp. BP-252]|uniref:bifunctional adenosylcobinamide kinase/adenosylcobinamide-phosphate guanylyltransferase n=1 Tax=unclassified Rhodococcus (in: high G+C Gram-positive bacteria) TaxID=192944 RepID=UPI001C9B0518|nr:MULTISPECIES: bifunctional adenosylcobinamide kinase/adenosylcobinamide-phosphate guanylyltransferase [unclassified Rhodococcus (in: high G+C Gram-positive bacteria)]MBY6411405.1 bifunctional adenosylcobinamide kinase/adenosylcobinamide-phosphate guanylyltransferase [Rhodococcus sp. BP-320]MBY6416064.1 bifunctional adenosylcobinamide kinase/adenosylcobinamide-phosphate guanylyltransferase [Rhodococcus sp. BP-321]MBY6420427.1 bifunctional adenosylcobinamide kinase/adenosylcobinamide-phosphate 
MTPGQRILVLGGTRSGKSAYAESLVDSASPVRYVATGRRDPSDADWQARIDSHVARRPAEWTTVEASSDLPAVIGGSDDSTIVDDLGTWLTHTIDDLNAWDSPRGTVAPRVDAVVHAVAAHSGHLVLVSPEVGMSVVSETRSGRLFQDEIGAMNSSLAAVCDTVVLVVAGLPLTLKSDPPSPHS